MNIDYAVTLALACILTIKYVFFDTDAEATLSKSSSGSDETGVQQEASGSWPLPICPASYYTFLLSPSLYHSLLSTLPSISILSQSPSSLPLSVSHLSVSIFDQFENSRGMH